MQMKMFRRDLNEWFVASFMFPRAVDLSLYAPGTYIDDDIKLCRFNGVNYYYY